MRKNLIARMCKAGYNSVYDLTHEVFVTEEYIIRQFFYWCGNFNWNGRVNTQSQIL